ncbi:cell division protein FtsQ/DivIB [Mariniluteicoccus flavus]
MSSVHDATAVIADRRKRGRRRRWIVIGVAAALVALVAGGIWAVFFSSLLALRTVAVTGTTIVSDEEVQRVAAAPVGRPLARVAERPVAERVATLPQVQSVTVRRHWPHTLDVAVKERTPAFALARGDRWLLVDATGVAFLEVAQRPEGFLPATAPDNDPSLLRGLAAVTAGLPPELRTQVETVEAKSADTITLKLKGREVVFGSADQVEVKAKVALALLASTKAAWIDVSAPGHPATR